MQTKQGTIQSLRALALGCGLIASACGAPADELTELANESSDAESQVPIGQVGQEIRAGTPGGGVGAVEVIVTRNGITRGCTGFLVGRHMVLTASHCFDDLIGTQSEVLVWAKIQWAESNGTSWRCMTDSSQTSSGKCAGFREVFVYRYGMGYPQYDMAAIFTKARRDVWQNVSAADSVFGLYSGPSGKGNPYTLFGAGIFEQYGTASGTMRFMNDRLDWVGTRHFVTDASDGWRVCNGDSGGPYFLSGGRWAFGLHTQSSEMWGNCAAPGSKMRGMRLIREKINKINDWRFSEALPACRQHSTSFPDFWICD